MQSCLSWLMLAQICKTAVMHARSHEAVQAVLVAAGARVPTDADWAHSEGEGFWMYAC